jgi:phosphoribosylformylglycinamidine cyclo-ligase
MGINYKTAGVDTEAGDELVEWLQSNPSPTPHSDRIVSGIGGFASLFNIQFPEIKKPLLVTCTDGVGTKVKIASQFEDYSTVGQDLVAMCVNDLICTGGRPLMFLDYYATGKLNLRAAQGFLASVRKACAESDCALIGGETAEMPGVYQGNDFDCAGFAVGLVDADKTWGPHRVQDGDVLVGLSSSGFHSNGYSLLRQVFAKDLETYKDQLLTPTSLYVKVSKKIQEKVAVHAAAHITGGGIENLPRVLPAHLGITIPQLWKLPEIYDVVRARTGMSDFELLKTLNCGIGFVFFVNAADANSVCDIARGCGFQAQQIGQVHGRKGDQQVRVSDLGELCEPRS